MGVPKRKAEPPKASKAVSGSKSANSSKSSNSDGNEHILFPLLPLPSAKLCLVSSVPSSCLRERPVDTRLRLLNFKLRHGLVDDDNLIAEYQRMKPSPKTQAQLLKEEQVMRSLMRYLQFGIYNKRQIMSIAGMDLGCFRNNYAGLKKMSEYGVTSLFPASLVRSILTYKPKARVKKYSNNTSQSATLCLDPNPFSAINESCGMPKIIDWCPVPRARLLSEAEMFENLCSGLLCNGDEPKSAQELLKALVIEDAFEHISPRFFTLVTSDARLVAERESLGA